MNIKTQNLVSHSEANQNFSKVARSVDENGAAVILKNNNPKYILFNFDEFMALDSGNDGLIDIAKNVLKSNKEAFCKLSE